LRRLIVPDAFYIAYHLLDGDFRAALESAQHAVLARPNCDASVVIKAAILNRLGRPQEALEMNRRALSLREHFATPGAIALSLNNMGLVLGDLGDFAEALGYLNRARAIKAELGEGVEVEPWDKGWAKVYETIPLESFEPPYLEKVALRLAQLIAYLQPILDKAKI